MATNYEYKVVPFRAAARGTATPEQIANQLETAITVGFELLQVATVTVDVAPGCLGGLLGHSVQSHTYEQLVFRRER